MTSIVAIDIETTGLDPRRDAIIEIGAVRFNEDGIQDEWRSFVNPGRPIPTFITQLTGIKNEDVVSAPLIKSIIPELAVFVEESPILGQNILFDLGFIRRQGIFSDNPYIDTFELAALLLPAARRYNLGALGIELGLPITEDLHRALDDARLTYRVYTELYRRLIDPEKGLSTDLLAEILRLSEPFEWGGRLPFEWAFRRKARAGLVAKRGGQVTEGLFGKANYSAPLKPNTDPKPVDVDEAAALLESGGAFAKYFPNFENRTQQVEMLRKVTQSFNDGLHLLVEAATGTGKSFAYLVPAALWAMQNNTRVIISTNTINLQEQLIKKDIPDLKQALGVRSAGMCAERQEQLSLSAPDGSCPSAAARQPGRDARPRQGADLVEPGRLRRPNRSDPHRSRRAGSMDETVRGR